MVASSSSAHVHAPIPMPELEPEPGATRLADLEHRVHELENLVVSMGVLQNIEPTDPTLREVYRLKKRAHDRERLKRMRGDCCIL